MEGRVLGRYRLLEEIGQGGMSVVYRGVDTTLDREVAVKILHPHLSRKKSSRKRFAREAKAVARLHHDNILEIYDFSQEENRDAYIVTELVRGETLEEFLQSHEPIPCEVGVLIVSEVASALGHAHELGVIHRDIKTDNVMIREDGIVKLMDFGIARLKEEVAATMTGLRMGTPHYMSPEQASGTSSDIDERADVFALGVLLYRLTTGSLPFEGPNPAVILMRIMEGEYDPAAAVNPAVGKAMGRLIHKALSTDRESRHANASAFREALEEVLQEAGFGSVRAELRNYFTSPDSYTSELNTRLASRYTELGREALKEGALPRALELFNRVLVIDPDNVAVKHALSRLGRQRRRSLYFAGALIGSLALTAMSYGLSVMERDWVDPLPSTSAPQTAAPTEVVIATTQPTPRSSARPTRTLPLAVLTPAIQTPPPPSSPEKTEATPKPTPLYATGFGGLVVRIRESGNVSVTDEAGNITQLGNTLMVRGREQKLPAGVYTVRVEPSVAECTVYAREINVIAGEAVVIGGYLSGCPTFMDLIPVPGAVLDGATLEIDGKVIATFPITTTLRTRSGTHQMRISKRGFVPYVTKLEIETYSQDAAKRVTIPALVPLK